MEKGRIEFECSDRYLTEGFSWAKEQALVYVHENAHVGKWYESALPDRDAFCMRDVSHHSRGAHALGLEEYTKNMMFRFAQSMAETRDFCCFWEIDKFYRPALVDYDSDKDFWYDLPANFDVIDACYRMYQLTGDTDYINAYDLSRFYDVSLNEYIERWDRDGDGIPEANPDCKVRRRGIPSYEEWADPKVAKLIDMLCIQQKGMRGYAEIKRLQGDEKAAEKYIAAADKIVEDIDKKWWDPEKNQFFYTEWQDGRLTHFDDNFWRYMYLLYCESVSDDKKRAILLDYLHEEGIKGVPVEVESHLSEIFYRYGQNDRGLYWLKKTLAPDLYRREYPEVSYAAVGNFVFEFMGIKYDVKSKTITAEPHIPSDITYASLKNLPVYGKEADVMFENGRTTIKIR